MSMIERNVNSLKQCPLFFDVTKHQMQWEHTGCMLGGRKSDTAFYVTPTLVLQSYIWAVFIRYFHTNSSPILTMIGKTPNVNICRYVTLTRCIICFPKTWVWKEASCCTTIISVILVFKVGVTALPESQFFKDAVGHIKSMRMTPASFLSEVTKLMNLILVTPTTKAVSERSFSTLRGIKKLSAHHYGSGEA